MRKLRVGALMIQYSNFNINDKSWFFLIQMIRINSRKTFPSSAIRNYMGDEELGVK